MRTTAYILTIIAALILTAAAAALDPTTIIPTRTLQKPTGKITFLNAQEPLPPDLRDVQPPIEDFADGQEGNNGAVACTLSDGTRVWMPAGSACDVTEEHSVNQPAPPPPPPDPVPAADPSASTAVVECGYWC